MPYFEAINDKCECEAECLRADEADSVIDAAAYGTEAESLLYAYTYTHCRGERAGHAQAPFSHSDACA